MGSLNTKFFKVILDPYDPIIGWRNMKRTILVVDDDSDLLKLLSTMLGQEGFNVITANNGDTAIKKVKTELPHLLILDVQMPEKNGLEVCKVLKQDENTRYIPIIMLTGRADEIDRVVGLELGAEDYIVKPFSVREMILRVTKVLRRTYGEETNSGIYKVGILSVDSSKHEVKVQGKIIDLTLTEFKILSCLIQNPGQVKTRETLLNEVWGFKEEVFSRTVDTHMQRLRSKLKDANKYIKTIRGVGYLFKE
jgi:DNA-binding response OmpR family regulator